MTRCWWPQPNDCGRLTTGRGWRAWAWSSQRHYFQLALPTPSTKEDRSKEMTQSWLRIFILLSDIWVAAATHPPTCINSPMLTLRRSVNKVLCWQLLMISYLNTKKVWSVGKTWASPSHLISEEVLQRKMISCTLDICSRTKKKVNDTSVWVFVTWIRVFNGSCRRLSALVELFPYPHTYMNLVHVMQNVQSRRNPPKTTLIYRIFENSILSCTISSSTSMS